MNLDPVEVTVSLAVGIGLGLFYFGALRLTVQHLPGSRRAVLWTFISFVLRLAVFLVVFVSITQGDAVRMIAALIGFMLMRWVLLRRWGTLEARD
jgi:F1F0 ATPase subunit 2